MPPATRLSQAYNQYIVHHNIAGWRLEGSLEFRIPTVSMIKADGDTPASRIDVINGCATLIVDRCRGNQNELQNELLGTWLGVGLELSRASWAPPTMLRIVAYRSMVDACRVLHYRMMQNVRRRSQEREASRSRQRGDETPRQQDYA